MEDEPLLPKFDYYLDESDPDMLVLRRQDGAFAAAFSAQGISWVYTRRGGREPGEGGKSRWH